jgi:hypothetical protein
MRRGLLKLYTDVDVYEIRQYSSDCVTLWIHSTKNEKFAVQPWTRGINGRDSDHAIHT